MALGWLITLAFWPKRLAGVPWLFAENLNYLNRVRGPDGQAFPLPSFVWCLFAAIGCLLGGVSHSVQLRDFPGR